MKYPLILFLVGCTPSMTYQPPQHCPIKHKVNPCVTVKDYVWDKKIHKWVQVGQTITESMDTVDKNNDTVNSLMNSITGSKPKVLQEDSKE